MDELYNLETVFEVGMFAARCKIDVPRDIQNKPLEVVKGYIKKALANSHEPGEACYSRLVSFHEDSHRLTIYSPGGRV